MKAYLRAALRGRADGAQEKSYAAARQRGGGQHQLLVNDQRFAERVEDGLRPVQPGAVFRGRAETGHGFAYRYGRVGHGPDQADLFFQPARQLRRAHARNYGDDQVAPGVQRGGDLARQGFHLLRPHGQYYYLRAFYRGAVIEADTELFPPQAFQQFGAAAGKNYLLRPEAARSGQTPGDGRADIAGPEYRDLSGAFLHCFVPFHIFSCPRRQPT